MTKKQLDAFSVLAILARMHCRTLAEEVDKHNAYLEQHITNGDLHPAVSMEEHLTRIKAVKRRALDEERLKGAALGALKPKPRAEEIAANGLARAARKKASRRHHRIKAPDALRSLRAKTAV